MNKKDYNIEYIKEWYKKNKNGLLITNRQIGKTEALIEILYEEICLNKKNLYILTVNTDMKHTIKKRIDKKYKNKTYFDNPSEKELSITKTLKQFIINYSDYQQLIFSNKLKEEQLLIDEYFFQLKLFKNFRFAISTMEFPIQIKKFENKKNEDRLRKYMTEIDWKKEITLEFEANFE